MDQLGEIKRKLGLLAEADKDLRLFGADKHKYALNPCLDEAQVREIEQKYGFELPEGYRRFIMELGNGGAGPYYGIDPLEKSFPTRIMARDPDLMSKPFPLTKELFVMRECLGSTTLDEYYERIETDDAYYDKIQRCVGRFNKPRYSQGALFICDYGDGITFLLVVKGKERGNIWVDDRVGDNGAIQPVAAETAPDSRTDFLTWYERWLDVGLAMVGDNPPESSGYMDYARL